MESSRQLAPKNESPLAAEEFGRALPGNHSGSCVRALMHAVLLKREALARDSHQTANSRASLGQLGHMEPAAEQPCPSLPILFNPYGIGRSQAPAELVC